MDGVCVRCGRYATIEEHHKIHKAFNGSNEPSNLESRCVTCHKYEHARQRLLRKLDSEDQPHRVYFIAHRLIVLTNFNTREATRERGTYKPYWDDPATHKLPRKLNKGG